MPFASRSADGTPISELVRGVLATIARVDVGIVPAIYTDELGAWCSQHFVDALAPAEQLAASRALGLLP